MSGVLVRLTLFFPVLALVLFVWLLLLLDFPVWLLVILVAAFGLAMSLVANALLGPLLAWYVRERLRKREADRVQQMSYRGW